MSFRTRARGLTSSALRATSARSQPASSFRQLPTPHRINFPLIPGLFILGHVDRLVTALLEICDHSKRRESGDRCLAQTTLPSQIISQLLQKAVQNCVVGRWKTRLPSSEVIGRDSASLKPCRHGVRRACSGDGVPKRRHEETTLMICCDTTSSHPTNVTGSIGGRRRTFWYLLVNRAVVFWLQASVVTEP